MTTQQQQQQAADLAGYHGTEVEPWMLWDGWTTHIGCAECSDGGPAAACWGQAECHGFEHGCGCSDCQENASFLALFDMSTPAALWEDPAA